MKEKPAILLASQILLVLVAVMIPFGYSVEWIPDERLTFDDSQDQNPATTETSDGEIWVVWQSHRVGNYEIYYKFYDGATWSSDARLTWDSAADRSPSITQTNDGEIWVVWSSNRHGDYGEIYYKTYDGSAWSADIRLTTNTTCKDEFPAIVQAADGGIWVVWDSDRADATGQLEIFYKIFDGSSWSDDIQLTYDSKFDDWNPAIVRAADGSIWVVWAKGDDIYYNVFDGVSWSEDGEMRLTWDPDNDLNPSITQTVNGEIWVVWDSFRNHVDENLYYKVYDGFLWSPDVQLTNNIKPDQMASITAATDGTIWVVWDSIRLGNYDLYYKYYKSDVAIASVAASPGLIARGETLSIEVQVQNQGTNPEDFQVQVYANSTQIDAKTVSLTAGQSKSLSFLWNTSLSTKPGRYVINATATVVPGEIDVADNSKLDGIVRVTLVGDICGMYSGVVQPVPDGQVNLYDFSSVALYIFSTSPSWDPVWGPMCDINNDGYVGIDDIMTVGIHFGERE